MFYKRKINRDKQHTHEQTTQKNVLKTLFWEEKPKRLGLRNFLKSSQLPKEWRVSGKGTYGEMPQNTHIYWWLSCACTVALSSTLRQTMWYKFWMIYHRLKYFFCLFQFFSFFLFFNLGIP